MEHRERFRVQEVYLDEWLSHRWRRKGPAVKVAACSSVVID